MRRSPGRAKSRDHPARLPRRSISSRRAAAWRMSSGLLLVLFVAGLCLFASASLPGTPRRRFTAWAFIGALLYGAIALGGGDGRGPAADVGTGQLYGVHLVRPRRARRLLLPRGLPLLAKQLSFEPAPTRSSPCGSSRSSDARSSVCRKRRPARAGRRYGAFLSSGDARVRAGRPFVDRDTPAPGRRSRPPRPASIAVRRQAGTYPRWRRRELTSRARPQR